jgi:predicted dehydrogenase
MTLTRWGILGPGRIAHSFASDLALVEDAELVAVGSRSLDRASAFTAEHGGTAYGSYEELLADGLVDAVYVASPHGVHVEHVTACLEAGKPVLCEKPITLRAADARALFELAVSKELLLMEAMWTACHPVIRSLVDLLARGEYGVPHQLSAELGFVVASRAADEPGAPLDRLLDPALGAGALLDMGIYPLTFAHLVLGEALDLRAVAALAGTGPSQGIDLDVAVVGRYPGGALATMRASMTSWSSRRAEIATDRGRIVLEDFHHPTSAYFTPTAVGGTNDHTERLAPEEIPGQEAVIGRGYGNEAVEFARCLHAGLLESPLVPHAQTLALMEQMDTIRAQVGIRYAGD